MYRMLSCLILLMWTHSASGFDSWEHKRLSDLAYHVATQIHCPDTSTDDMCANMRPEDDINVATSGDLYKWCQSHAEEGICELLRKMYAKFPRSEYDASGLAKSCAKKGHKNAACKDVESLSSSIDDLSLKNFQNAKEVLKWCHKRGNRSDGFCSAFEAQQTAMRKTLRDLTLACFADRNLPCNFTHLDAAERLSWASFYDPLSVRTGEPAPKHQYDSDMTYGDVTKCVDYFLTPEKLMAGSETALWRNSEDLQLNERGRITRRMLFPEQREHLDIKVVNRCKEGNGNLEGARAGHVNHTHFQAELLIAQRTHHMLAVTLHGVEQNRFAGLTANAISDHYLQDSLAPGHITTWRSRLTDLAANAYHDKRNRMGMHVQIDVDSFNKMMEGEKKNDAPLHEKFLELASKDGHSSKASVIREHFLFPDKKRGSCEAFRCDETKRQGQEEITLIAGLINSLKGKLVKDNESTKTHQAPCIAKHDLCVKLHGDGSLWKKGQDEQRLLLLLLQVRSILDVLESRPIGRADKQQFTLKDSFKDNQWSWLALEDSPGGVKAIIPPPSYLAATIGPVQYQIAQSNSRDKIYNHSYQDFDRVFGIGIGIDNMTFGLQQNRKTISLESVVLGLARESAGSMNFAAMVGVQRHYEPISNGYGLNARVSIVFPQTETIVSIPFRRIKIGENKYEQWKSTAGLRIDQGFTSFATVFLQFNRDYAAQLDGRIESGVSIGAGVQIAAPRCRVPMLGKYMCD